MIATGEEKLLVGRTPTLAEADPLFARAVGAGAGEDHLLGFAGRTYAAIRDTSPRSRAACCWLRPGPRRAEFSGSGRRRPGTVKWAGDPNAAKAATSEREGTPIELSPRKSFALWIEVHQGRSLPWTESDLEAAAMLQDRLSRELLRQASIRESAERAVEQQKLADANTRISLATSIGGIGIWDWDRVTNEAIWDARMYELFGRGAGLGARRQLRAVLALDPSGGSASGRQHHPGRHRRTQALHG